MADNALTRAAAGGGAQHAKKRNALLDFIQSASNAIAQNVSGPVDLIGAGLRFAGVPVPEDAIGSSRWMADRGLTAEVPMGAARVFGETAGMVGPIAGAQFAPQIAAWRNAVNERLAPGAPGKIPTSIPRGAIVYHGSPHKFDRFDSSKIGTGEGAQAYGHGLYLADSPGVAKSYADKLGVIPDPTISVDPTLSDKAAAFASNALKSYGFDPKQAAAALYRSKQRMGAEEAKRAATDAIGALKHGRVRAIVERDYPEGHLYKVDLPDSAIARMLDWDKPLSQQAPEVRAAIAKLPKGWVSDRGMRRFYDPTRAQRSGQGLLQDLQLFNRGTPEAMLRDAGIPGIRYLDGGSRSAGAGTSNYVVFPGEENILQILARNGIPLTRGKVDLSSRASLKIRGSNPLPQRPFSHDYPTPATGSVDGARLAHPTPPTERVDGARLAQDIDGRPLVEGATILGRRVAGGVDEGLGGDAYGLASSLRIPFDKVPAKQIGGDAGRFSTKLGTTLDPRISLADDLTPDQAGMVLQHELGPALDKLSGGASGAGVQRELAHVYDFMNNRFGQSVVPRLAKKQHTPLVDGYVSPAKARDEQWAEAFRLYMIDPNAMKTIAPKTAAAIRKAINAHPTLSKAVQFNSAALGAGMLAWGDRGEPD